MPIPLVVQTSLPWPKFSAGAELYCFFNRIHCLDLRKV